MLLRRLRRKASEGLYKGYLGLTLPVTSRFPIGTNVYEREWDVLVILDTCRVDALRATSEEYQFLDDITAITSVGSTTREWIANTFTMSYRDDIRQTSYLSANAFTKRVLENRKLPAEGLPVRWDTVQARVFNHLEQTWEYQPPGEFKHMLPEHLTDRAITFARQQAPERLIVHYSQPHAPYIARAKTDGRELLPHEADPFDSLRSGQIDRSDVWAAYLSNLRMVLDSVELLLDNMEAETVVLTADHGEAFGEWGQYGHPMGTVNPCVKQVPWAVTSATDRGNYDPSFGIEGESVRNVEEQLRDLGYRA